jgi:hypothetical protein
MPFVRVPDCPRTLAATLQTFSGSDRIHGLTIYETLHPLALFRKPGSYVSLAAQIRYTNPKWVSVETVTEQQK